MNDKKWFGNAISLRINALAQDPKTQLLRRENMHSHTKGLQFADLTAPSELHEVKSDGHVFTEGEQLDGPRNPKRSLIYDPRSATYSSHLEVKYKGHRPR